MFEVGLRSVIVCVGCGLPSRRLALLGLVLVLFVCGYLPMLWPWSFVVLSGATL